MFYARPFLAEHFDSFSTARGAGIEFMELLVPEPGWKLMRRQFGGRVLGHVYVYRETWPQTTPAGDPAAAPSQPPAPPVRGLW